MKKIIRFIVYGVIYSSIKRIIRTGLRAIGL